MNQLPQELIDDIARRVPRNDLKNVLTLSSKFRYAAERYSGVFAEFYMNERNTEKFIALFSNHRLSFLRKVSFRPRLSTIDYRYDPKVPCRETADELREKDDMFTRQISLLFATLKTTEECAGARNSLGKYRLALYSPIRLVDKDFGRSECLHHYYVSWRVHLLNVSKLPSITSVRSVDIHNNDPDYDWDRDSHKDPVEIRKKYDRVESKLDLRIIIDLATKFPNLEFLGCKVGGYEWCRTYGEEQPAQHYEHDWEGPRRDARHDFARAVDECASQLPASLSSASLDFLSPLDNSVVIHHDRRLPDLVAPAIKDPFTSSLNILTSNLRKLQLRTMADETLFDSNGDAVTWPHLEILDVMFHIACPTGKWYFHGPRGEGRKTVGFPVTEAGYPPYEASAEDQEMESLLHEWGSQRGNVGEVQFRVVPDDANLKPLLESFAKAAIRMPSLKTAVLWTPLAWAPGDEYSDDEDYQGFYEAYPRDDCSDLAWGIAFAAPGLPPGTIPSPDKYIAYASRQLWWRVGSWRPDAGLHELFQQIGRERYGDELLEDWTDHICGDDLVYRDCFENALFDGDFGRVGGWR